MLSLSIYKVLYFSVAKCLGAVTVCETSFHWTFRHKIISHVIEDVEAVDACLQFLGINCSFNKKLFAFPEKCLS